jgi:hypothetical protein
MTSVENRKNLEKFVINNSSLEELEAKIVKFVSVMNYSR